MTETGTEDNGFVSFVVYGFADDTSLMLIYIREKISKLCIAMYLFGIAACHFIVDKCSCQIECQRLLAGQYALIIEFEGWTVFMAIHQLAGGNQVVDDTCLVLMGYVFQVVSPYGIECISVGGRQIIRQVYILFIPVYPIVDTLLFAMDMLVLQEEILRLIRPAILGIAIIE